MKDTILTYYAKKPQPSYGLIKLSELLDGQKVVYYPHDFNKCDIGTIRIKDSIPVIIWEDGMKDSDLSTDSGQKVFKRCFLGE